MTAAPDPMVLRLPLALLVAATFLFLGQMPRHRVIAAASAACVAILTGSTYASFGQFAALIAFYWAAAAFIMITFAYIALAERAEEARA